MIIDLVGKEDFIGIVISCSVAYKVAETPQDLCNIK
jgi:hypothetical protein